MLPSYRWCGVALEIRGRHPCRHSPGLSVTADAHGPTQRKRSAAPLLAFAGPSPRPPLRRGTGYSSSILTAEGGQSHAAGVAWGVTIHPRPAMTERRRT